MERLHLLMIVNISCFFYCGGGLMMICHVVEGMKHRDVNGLCGQSGLNGRCGGLQSGTQCH